MEANKALSKRFLTFAEQECKGSSSLYEYLSIEISKDETVLALSSHALVGQPVPNLLFGAVHFLLLKGKDHPLKEYYPSLVENPKPFHESFAHFRDFCLTFRDEIISILKTRLVQTNEVRRCAYLYPVFCTIYEKVQRPLALIEIGTSAGLQLLFDQFAYSYDKNKVYGKIDSRLHLTAEIRGEHVPSIHTSPPPVTKRIGLDLNTIDLTDEEEKLWLKALIWPEHEERLYMLEEASSYLSKVSIELVDGDGISLFPRYAERIPKDSILCVFHTHVANQMPTKLKKKLLQTVEDIGKTRDVFHIYNNMDDMYLHLDHYLNGKLHKHTIAETDGHGRWFKWLLERDLLVK